MNEQSNNTIGVGTQQWSTTHDRNEISDKPISFQLKQKVVAQICEMFPQLVTF